MQEFIESAAEKLGIDKSIAEKATGVVLGFIKSKLGDSDFGDLAAKLPGATGLLETAGGGGDSAGGGMLGGVMKMASSAIGGGAGDALELTGKLKDSGLGLDQFGSFGTMLMDFVKDKAGEGAVGTIVEKIPELKKMLG
jgi:hypothetical protein